MLNREIRKIINLFVSLFFVAISIVSFYLLFYSFNSSWFNLTMSNEYVTYCKDNVFTNLCFVIVVFAAILYFLNKDENYVTVICFFTIFIIGIYLCLTSGTYPEADQHQVMQEAVMLNKGSYDSLISGGYISCYPHLLGLVTFFRIIFYIFGNYNVVAIRISNLIFLLVLFVFGQKYIKDLYGEKASNVFSITMVLCIPIYGYLLFVYGELPSICFIIVSFYYFNRYLCRRRIKYLVFFGFSLFLSIAFKQNSLIVLIAFLIGSIINLSTLQKAESIYLVFCVFVIFISTGICEKVYQKKYDVSFNPVPSIAWVAMGVNEDVSDMNGWNNGFNYDFYHLIDCDSEMMSEESEKIISNFMKKNISSKINFINKKIITQWNNPTYQFLNMNSNIVTRQGRLEYLAFSNKGIEYVNNYCNIYQLFIYLMFFSFAIYKTINKKYTIGEIIPMIAVFGGFLFSIVWEAKPRYIFPYLIMMLPYVSCIMAKISEQLMKNKNKKLFRSI